jgi:molecular chaperone DnaK
MRKTIDYGIDLGTTNSAIANMIKGVPKIIKTETQKDTLPSCVYFGRHKNILVGDAAKSAMKRDIEIIMRTTLPADARMANNVGVNSFIEFKRTMGTDHTYNSAHMDKVFTPEELSAEVLKKLKSFEQKENLSSIVITVPAKFLSPQNEATIKAANLAGFKQVVLLQEPIAALTAYGFSAGADIKEGYWLVFDFGGGTFDAALVKAEDGILSVKDTEGDNWLGGKNLDEAIVDHIILPHLQQTFSIEDILNDPVKKNILRSGVKQFAEEAKNQMSFDTNPCHILSQPGDLPFTDKYDKEVEVDVVVTLKELDRVLSPVFQKAIDITKELLKRNNLRGADLDELILVGGPTHSTILQRMLREQITEKMDTTTDPMTIVAQGAAIYASGIETGTGTGTEPKPKSKSGSGSIPVPKLLQLEVNHSLNANRTSGTVLIKALKEKSTTSLPDMFVELKRTDEAWSSGLNRISDTQSTIIEIKLLEKVFNSFEIQAFDREGNRLETDPDRIDFMPVETPPAPLPYHIGIAKYFELKDGLGFFSIKGLEKNKQLPATGVANRLRTTCVINKGTKDTLRVGVYQGDYNAESTDPELNDLICEIIITGETIPETLPKDSDVDITISIDKSQKMHFSAYFPKLEYAEETVIDTKQTVTPSAEEILEKISNARQVIRDINAIGEISKPDKQIADKINKRLSELEDSLNSEGSDALKRLEIQNNLRKQLFELYPVEVQKRYWQAEKKMMDTFYELDAEINEIKNSGINRMPGYDGSYLAKAEAMRNDFPGKKEDVMRDKNMKKVHEVTVELAIQKFLLGQTPTGGAQCIMMFDDNFDSYEWENREQARQLIAHSMSLIAEAVSSGRIPPTMDIVYALFNLLPKGLNISNLT